MKDWSQHGESTILHQLFQTYIVPKHRVAVEFGAGDGYKHSNIRMFMEDGWRGVQWDADTWVTAGNVNDLFAAHDVPPDVDLVSIDIDGNDYWVWKALRWEPSVVIIEYNSGWPHGDSVTIPYDPDHQWNRDAYHGASFDAMVKLGAEKGYFPFYEIARANIIFVHKRWRLSAPSINPAAVSLPYQRFGEPVGVWEQV